MRPFAACAIACVLLVLPMVASPAGPGIFLRDEPEVYVPIDKLQGLGLRSNRYPEHGAYRALHFGVGGWSGRDESIKSIELSAAWQYR